MRSSWINFTNLFDGNPDDTRQALQGISRISQTVASRDDELRRLISSTRTVTDVVHDQQGNLMHLLSDSDKVAAMINQRREAIRSWDVDRPGNLGGHQRGLLADHGQLRCPCACTGLRLAVRRCLRWVGRIFGTGIVGLQRRGLIRGQLLSNFSSLL